MKDQLYFRVFTTNRSIWRRKMEKWQLYKYHPKQRVFVWIGRTGQEIIRVCMEFCNFCKVPIWTIFHRKLLNLVGQLFIHQHSSFNVQILDFLSNLYKKLAPVPSRFCNGLCSSNTCSYTCVVNEIRHTLSDWPETLILTFEPYQLPYQEKLHFA